MTSKRLIICGLGNPGEQYRSTRHNTGFLFLDAFTNEHGLSWSKKGEIYDLAESGLLGWRVILIRPRTFVNMTGEAVEAFGKTEPFTPEELLAVCDDLSLPLGSIRLRAGGGDGGHKGLKSIIESLNTDSFPRLRLGIGPPPPSVDPADFVLSEFLEKEGGVVRSMLEMAVECVQLLLTKGIDRAMSRYNAREPREETD